MASPIAAVTAEIARRELAALLSAHPEIQFSVLTSSDGLHITAYPEDGPVAQRVGVMSSSVRALSDAISREAGLGDSRNLIVDSDGGTILVLGLPNTTPRISLAVVAPNNENLARLLWVSRDCCTRLGRILQP